MSICCNRPPRAVWFVITTAWYCSGHGASPAPGEDGARRLSRQLVPPRRRTVVSSWRCPRRLGGGVGGDGEATSPGYPARCECWGEEGEVNSNFGQHEKSCWYNLPLSSCNWLPSPVPPRHDWRLMTRAAKSAIDKSVCSWELFFFFKQVVFFTGKRATCSPFSTAFIPTVGVTVTDSCVRTNTQEEKGDNLCVLILKTKKTVS